MHGVNRVLEMSGGNSRAFAVLALGLLVLSTGAAATDQRPPLKGVSAIRIGNYGAPSVMVEGREQLRPIIDEMNALRSKPWRRGDTKLRCYATLVFLDKGKTVALFRVGPGHVVDRHLDKEQTSHNLAIADADIPNLTRFLTEIPPPKCE